MPAILFVCLGNICRSPTAEAVFAQMAQDRGLGTQFVIDSAGTGGWHAGDPPDPRTRTAGQARGYSFAGQAARQVTARDFEDFDYILAMDRQNLRDLQRQCPEGARAQLHLFLGVLETQDTDVPDPYYGGAGGFDRVLDLVEQASIGWIDRLSSPSSG